MNERGDAKQNGTGIRRIGNIETRYLSVGCCISRLYARRAENEIIILMNGGNKVARKNVKGNREMV